MHPPQSNSLAQESSGQQSARVLKSPLPQDLHDLTQLLQRQGQQYHDLLQLLESLDSSVSIQETRSQAVLNSIQHQLQNLNQTKQQLLLLERRVGTNVSRHSPELAQELRRQEMSLQKCLARIARLESHFTERRKRLRPELDDSARRRSMQSAYQQSMKTG